MTKSPFSATLGARLFVLAGACLPLSYMSAAGEASEPVFAELFTSQGCSSCPEADKIWADLQKKPGVVAISFNIDYWDYAGWKDTLAKRENTLRQQAYAKAMPSRQVYTPQVIIDGQRDVVGNERDPLMNAIDARQAQVKGKRVAVTLTQDGNTVKIHVAAGSVQDVATVWVAHTISSKTVKIGEGENSGKQIVYTNVVRDFAAAGSWNGQATTLQVPAFGTNKAEATDGVAVWVQQGSNGPVSGAAQIRVSQAK